METIEDKFTQLNYDDVLSIIRVLSEWVNFDNKDADPK